MSSLFRILAIFAVILVATGCTSPQSEFRHVTIPVATPTVAQKENLEYLRICPQTSKGALKKFGGTSEDDWSPLLPDEIEGGYSPVVSKWLYFPINKEKGIIPQIGDDMSWIFLAREGGPNVEMAPITSSGPLIVQCGLPK